MRFRKSGCNHEKERKVCLRPMRKKIIRCFKREIKRGKFRSKRKAKFPSKPQFVFISTIVVTKDVIPIFVGLVLFRTAFIQQPVQKDMLFLIFSLPSFQHHPSLLD